MKRSVDVNNDDFGKRRKTVQTENYIHVFEGIHSEWSNLIQSHANEEKVCKLNNFLHEEMRNYTVYPRTCDRWKWTTLPIENVKVVILGQDPYPNPGQADGLAFSTNSDKCPRSLENIFKLVKSEYPVFNIPTDNFTLNGWLDQGVLLLNTVLTVRENDINSHKNQGWEHITATVIKLLSEIKENLVFMLWGKSAQKICKQISNIGNHLVLETSHPSPLSVRKGFLKCNHFSRCNEYLLQHNITPIDWTITTSTVVNM